MAMMTIAAFSAVGSIMQGRAAEKQAQFNAQIYEQQAGFSDVLSKLETERLDIGMGIDLTQQLRAKSKMASTLMAYTAGAGLEYSGSPVAVMLDNLTQAGIDEEITKYNYAMEKSATIYGRQQEKIGYLSRASQERYAGKMAKSSAYSSAFTTLMKGAYTSGARRGWIKTSTKSGANANPFELW